MAQDIVAYLVNHPQVFIGLGALILILAALGLWYVISHHLQVIVITSLCAAGIISGGVVFYRGAAASMTDLMVIGAFLIVIFPIIYLQAIRLSYAEPPPAKANEGRAARKAPA